LYREKDHEQRVEFFPVVGSKAYCRICRYLAGLKYEAYQRLNQKKFY